MSMSMGREGWKVTYILVSLSNIVTALANGRLQREERAGR